MHKGPGKGRGKHGKQYRSDKEAVQSIPAKGVQNKGVQTKGIQNKGVQNKGVIFYFIFLLSQPQWRSPRHQNCQRQQSDLCATTEPTTNRDVDSAPLRPRRPFR